MSTFWRGLPELRAKLRAIPKELQSGANSPVRFGLLKSSNVIRDRAKQLVSVKSGVTQASIKSRVTPKRRQRAGHVSREIYTSHYVARFVEFGTGVYHSGQKIKPKKARILMNRGTREIFGTTVKGQPPKPFMRPAVYQSQDEAVRAFQDGFRAKIRRLEVKARK